MPKDRRWPTKPFLLLRTPQLLVGIALCLLSGFVISRIGYLCTLVLALFTVLYIVVTIWCFFTERLNPTSILYFDFIIVFLWIIVITLLQSKDYTGFGVASVAALEMMLFVPTTVIAAVVMYQTQKDWSDGEDVVEEQPIDLESATEPHPRILEIGTGAEVREDAHAHPQEMPVAH